MTSDPAPPVSAASEPVSQVEGEVGGTATARKAQAFMASLRADGGEEYDLADPELVKALVDQFFGIIREQMREGAKTAQERDSAIHMLEELAGLYADLFSGATAQGRPARHWNGRTLAETLGAEGVEAREALKDWFSTDIAAQYIAATSHHSYGNMTDEQYRTFINELEERTFRELMGPDYKVPEATL
ncbi:hypothetical protein [Oecophyllibacter saccharovorans]|uniref:hypothetical protein n=1 Tax=Oecophyllibacter saccharovorans TaxID=2558360 RepID=UPI001167ED65|nr:hypothetical protein [Oecophyllibacter saccharovorans]TPW35166.1 hypothetical protein E3203_06800 [Oecophyllibacter saccharovorans]